MAELGLGRTGSPSGVAADPARRAAGRPTRPGSTSTTGSSTGCSPRHPPRSRRSTTGTCRRRSRTRAAGPTAPPPRRSPTTRASWRSGSATASTLWTTLNEPWCSAYLGYGSGVHAPAGTDAAQALAAVHHLNLAHGLAVRRCARSSPDDAGFSVTLNLHVTPPGDPTRRRRRVRRIDASPTGPSSARSSASYPEDVIADTASVTDWSFVKRRRPRRHRASRSTCSASTTTRPSPCASWDGVSPRANADGHKDMGGPPWPGSEDVEFLEQPGRTPRWAGTSTRPASRTCSSRCTARTPRCRS